jgi:hypothetical protein
MVVGRPVWRGSPPPDLGTGVRMRAGLTCLPCLL